VRPDLACLRGLAGSGREAAQAFAAAADDQRAMSELELPTAVIIDDSRVTRRMLRGHIEAAGYRVVAEGGDGGEVLSLYQQHLPAVMFIDIVLPVMDGVTAATELLRQHPRAMVVMCTAQSSRDKIIACLRAGIFSYLMKPFDGDSVTKTLARVHERLHGAEVRARE
jgi:two-component system chemotaxis response regulator CheY